jgi:hypothetical protein
MVRYLHDLLGHFPEFDTCWCMLLDIFNTNALSVYQGGLVDAVVPFMGESITDGTLATFLKRMSFNYVVLVDCI